MDTFGCVEACTEAVWMLKMQENVHRDTSWLNALPNKLEVNETKIVFMNSNMSVPRCWHFCSTDETILFGSSNNIVSRTKHKCLTSQTILFRGINIRFHPCFWITMHFELHGYSWNNLLYSIFSKCALAENLDLRKCVSNRAFLVSIG